MAIFTSTVTENLATTYDVPTYEGYGFETCGHIRALTEMCSDDLAITEACYAYDMAEIQGLRRINALTESYSDTSDAESELKATLEAKGKNVFQTIRDTLKRVWGKILDFFKSIGKYLRTFFGSVKEFCNRNKEAINKISFKKDITISTYDYDMNELTSKEKAKNVENEVLKFMNTAESQILSCLKPGNKLNSGDFNSLTYLKDNILDNIETRLINKSTENQLEFEKEVNGLFKGQNYSDGKKQKSFNANQVKQAFTDMQQAEKIQPGIDAFKNTMDKLFSTLIKQMDRHESEAEKRNCTSAVITIIQKCKSAVTSTQSYVCAYVNIWRSSIVSMIGDYTGLCRKAIVASGFKVYSNSYYI